MEPKNFINTEGLKLAVWNAVSVPREEYDVLLRKAAALDIIAANAAGTLSSWELESLVRAVIKKLYPEVGKESGDKDA